MKNYFNLSASLMFFLMFRSNFLIGQTCDNTPIAINAIYSIEEIEAGVVKITGGFDNRPFNSLKYRFNITILSAPDIVQSFTINFGNGQTQTLTFSQNSFPLTQSFDINYTTVGAKTITTTTGSTVTSTSQTLSVSFARALADPNYRSPTRTQVITGASFSPICQGFLPIAKDKQAGTASINMHTLLSPNNTTGHLVRPLIFVEGIDFDTETICDPNNVGGTTQNVHVGGFGWDNFITGVFQDPESSDNITFNRLPTLITQMRNEGYDIVFCDFVDGAD
jgi:hypothetical protein